MEASCIVYVSPGPLSMESLMETLNQPGIHFSLARDENDNFRAVYFQTENQRLLISQFGEMFQMDSTYKVQIINSKAHLDYDVVFRISKFM